MILVLDQFEEFLLYHPRPAETTFVQDLATLIADPDSKAHVLLSLREDSLAGLDALRAVIPGILSSPVQLGPLDRAAAEQAICKPVAKWSEQRFGNSKAVEVEDSLVEALLAQVQQTGAAGSTVDTPVNLVDLPLLQLALERIWEEAAARAETPALRMRTLDRLGGAAGIARQHLDDTVKDLEPAQRALAVRLFRHLVTATGGKHAWRADDLAEEIRADSRAEQQVADRVAGGPGGIGAEGRRLLGITEAAGGPEATKAAVSDTLNNLAQGEGADLAHPAGPARPGTAVRALPRCPRPSGAVLGARGAGRRGSASLLAFILSLSASSAAGSPRGFYLGASGDRTR